MIKEMGFMRGAIYKARILMATPFTHISKRVQKNRGSTWLKKELTTGHKGEMMERKQIG